MKFVIAKRTLIPLLNNPSFLALIQALIPFIPVSPIILNQSRYVFIDESY